MQLAIGNKQYAILATVGVFHQQVQIAEKWKFIAFAGVMVLRVQNTAQRRLRRRHCWCFSPTAPIRRGVDVLRLRRQIGVAGEKHHTTAIPIILLFHYSISL
jgi:hypothetical protein